jgi:hypothetical protein
MGGGLIERQRTPAQVGDLARRARATSGSIEEKTVTDASDDVRSTPPASLSCFGADPAPARVVVIPRDASWRTTRGLLALGIGIGLTPLVAIVPPHVPWAAASLIGGIVIARNRFRERTTLLSVAGTCPRCGGAVAQEPRRRLQRPHTVTCSACGETLLLECDTG